MHTIDDRPLRLRATTEQVVLGAALFWALALNGAFFTAVLRAPVGAARPWGLGAALFVLLVAVQALALGLVATRRSVKPLVAVLTVVGALALHAMHAFGITLDPSMARNVLASDGAEARELLSWSLLAHLALYGVLPLLVLAAVRVRERPLRRALLPRAALLAGAAGVTLLALIAQFQPLASLMRNHKEVRYLATPANAVWSFASVLASDVRGAARPRQAIGLDAAFGPGHAGQARPRLVVMVVGETARAANWGLSGYVRQTTPQLAALPGLLNFTQVTACGTSTEVSLPCMFAPVGRRAYDEARIRGSESLLHVAARAGVAVTWRDNQSGCKGVCAGLPLDPVVPAAGLCQGDRCLDEALLRGLDERLRTAAAGAPGATQLLVLHMLGNHGPSYFRRYPPTFERFAPACHDDDLGRCTRAEITNAYDNALLYTDHVLAALVGTLAAHANTVDSALVFASDHGESLGENGLFLHGMPYAVAPREQTRVPMVLWWSHGFSRTTGLDGACVAARAQAPVQHDHLFHTLLGLLDVTTSLHEPALDLTHGCRVPAH